MDSLAALAALSIILNGYLLWSHRNGFAAIRAALQVAKEQQDLASFWKQTAQRFQSLAASKEFIKAILDGEEGAFMEHPDPAVQADANKMMADLKRLAQKLQAAKGLRTKGSDEVN
jgi:hypothetical protein